MASGATIGGLGVSGAPGGNFDEECARGADGQDQGPDEVIPFPEKTNGAEGAVCIFSRASVTDRVVPPQSSFTCALLHDRAVAVVLFPEKAANSAGVFPAGSMPAARKRFLSSGSCMILRVSSEMRSVIALGVPPAP